MNQTQHGIICELEGKLARVEKELAELKRAIADPKAVWVNMLRGQIAMPQVYEAQAKLAAVEKERDEWLFAMNMCAGAAGIGDADELCGWIDRVKGERDEAQAKCVEMREVLEACDMYLAGACQPTNRGLIKHALSTDCGRGFVPVRELEPILDGARTIYAAPYGGTGETFSLLITIQSIAKRMIAQIEALKGAK